MIKNQRNITILSICVTIVVLFLLIFYFVDYRTKEEKNFNNSIIINSTEESNYIKLVIDRSVREFSTRLNKYATRIVDEDINFNSQEFRESMIDMGEIDILQFSSLSEIQKANLMSGNYRYQGEGYELIILAPIIKNDVIIGGIVSKHNRISYESTFINNYDLQSGMIVNIVNKEGQRLLSNMSYSNVNEAFSIIYDLKVTDLLAYMKSSSSIFMKANLDKTDYYTYISGYQDGYIIILSEARFFDNQKVAFSNIVNQFIFRIVLVILVFFGYIVFNIYWRNKHFKKNELQIETLNNSISGGIILASIDKEFRILYGNDGFYALIGYTKKEVDEIFDTCLRKLVFEEDLIIFDEIIKILPDRTLNDFKLRVISKNRGLIWLHMNFSCNDFGSGTVTIVLLDITESKNRNTEIKNLISSIPGSVLKLSAKDWEIEFASDSLLGMLGYGIDEFHDNFKYFFELMYEEDQIMFHKKVQTRDENIFLEARLNKKDGSFIWITFNAKKATNENNHQIYHCVIMDTTEQMETQIELRKETKKSMAVLEMTDEVICEYLIEEDKLLTTRKGVELFGFPPVIDNFYENIHLMNSIYPEDLPKFIEVYNGVFDIKSSYKLDMRIRKIDGIYEWYNLKSTTLYEDGIPYKVMTKITNINELTNRIEKLVEASQRDSLTGVYNNGNIARIVNEYLAAMGSMGNHAFIIFDLDDFKIINDYYGHAVGDGVLKEYALRLKDFFGSENLVGRIGGDEFVVLLKNCNTKMAMETIDKLHKILQKSYNFQGKNVLLTSSFGVSIYPKDGGSYEELFKNADLAGYYAKEKGKNNYAFFDKTMATEPTEVMNLTYRSSRTDALVLDSIEMLGKSQVIFEGVCNTFARICEFFNFDFAYVFEDHEETGFFECSYAFDLKTKTITEGNHKIHNPVSATLTHTVKKDSVLYISDLAMIKNELPELYKAMMRNNTKSVIVCGVFEQGELRCLISFASKKSLSYPSQQEITSIISVVRLIASYIYKLRDRQNLNVGNQLFQAILKNQELTAYAVDINTKKLLYLSPRLQKQFPIVKAGDLCYQSLFPGKHDCENCPIELLGDKERYSTYQYDETKKKWFGITVSRMDWADVNIEAALVYSFDISNYIENVTFKDPLTGLYNLSKFILEGNKIIKTQNNLYIVSFDVSNLSYINESLGYNVGNKLLIQLGGQVSKEINEDELCCLANNEKFIILFRSSSKEMLLKRITSFLNRSLSIVKDTIGNTTSNFTTGIYELTADDNEIMEAINKADLARKSGQADAIIFYGDSIIEQYAREKVIENRMEKALQDHEFKLYFQPKYDINTKEIVGLEALTRWQWDYETILYPDGFIPLFEKNGFISKMSYYVCEEVFKTLRKWIDLGVKVYPVAINISYNYLVNKDFGDDLIVLADKYNISRDLIEIELRESVFKENINNIVNVINFIHRAGFKVSFDDFGFGYSSLIMLKELPVDYLKLDKGFLKDGKIEDRDLIIIKNIISMARELGIVVVSEGVESLEQIEFLKMAGCDFVQGFYFSKPLPVEEIEKLINNKKN